MRKSVAVLVLAAFVAGSCSGSDEVASTDPPDPTMTSAPSTTLAAPTTTTATTISETTESPTTTVDDDEVRLRAAEQAYIASWEAYHAAILDPSDPELRAEVERLLTGPNLETANAALDEFVSANYVARPHPDRVSKALILETAQFVPGETDRVEMIVCEVNGESYFEVGSAPDGGDALVRDEVFVLEILVRMKWEDGQWRSESGERRSRLVGEVDCTTFL